MITLTESERKIYLDIRAEQIKEFQDRENGHLFLKPYSIELARSIAQQQLDSDIEYGKLRISLQDLLLLNNETCIENFQYNTIKRAKNYES